MATIDKEYLFNILNTCDEGLKVCFRTVERNLLKITASTSHLCFSETCLNVYKATKLANIIHIIQSIKFYFWCLLLWERGFGDWKKNNLNIFLPFIQVVFNVKKSTFLINSSNSRPGQILRLLGERKIEINVCVEFPSPTVVFHCLEDYV